jgi:hypothetical protein
LFTRFDQVLGNSAFVSGLEGVRLFAMYFHDTLPDKKGLIQSDLTLDDGHYRVIFATNALGLGTRIQEVFSEDLLATRNIKQNFKRCHSGIPMPDGQFLPRLWERTPVSKCKAAGSFCKYYTCCGYKSRSLLEVLPHQNDGPGVCASQS